MAEDRHLPVIDVSGGIADVAAEIDAACRDMGFFFVVGHGVSMELQARLDSLAREFFALDDAEKAKIDMKLGGRAWRGWFPVGGELTSGQPDMKEGLYFGQELPTSNTRSTDRISSPSGPPAYATPCSSTSRR